VTRIGTPLSQRNVAVRGVERTIDGKAEDGWMLPFTVIAPPGMPKAA
jgi:hypothetical protein